MALGLGGWCSCRVRRRPPGSPCTSDRSTALASCGLLGFGFHPRVRKLPSQAEEARTSCHSVQKKQLIFSRSKKKKPLDLSHVLKAASDYPDRLITLLLVVVLSNLVSIP